MLSPTAFWKSVETQAARNWPLLSALGTALAFAVMLGGVALAAYTADVADPATSLALGGIAIWLVKLYARGIRAVQRIIDRLHPPEIGQAAPPDGVPFWGSILYLLLFVALMFWAGAQNSTWAILGWAAGQQVLAYFFWRQNDPTAPSAFAVIDDALDRYAEPRRPMLRALGIAFGFIALFGGVALHAFHSGFAGAVAPGSTALTQVVVALGSGALAILFARLYVAITLAAQRILIDPWRYVRPEPPSRAIERWPLIIFAVIGIVLFITMSFVGQERAAGNISMSMEGNRFRVEIGAIGLLALLVGWGCGGCGVLRHFWAKARERAEHAHARA